MLSVPLPLLAGLVFVLTLHHNLKGVEMPGSRRYLVAFLVFYALQGLIVGLRFGYGIQLLGPVQPITAAFMPPLAFLAFRALAATPLEKPWLHLLGPASVAIAVLLLRDLVDPLLLAIFLGYGIALWRLTRSPDDDVMAEASLQRMRPALRAARLTAGLMLLFAASDAVLAVYTRFYGAHDVPFAVTIANLVAIVAVAAYCLTPDRNGDHVAQVAVAQRQPQDDAIVAQALSALEKDQLYCDENLSLAKLARKAGLPPRELSAAINRATGLNVSQFVNNRRIEEACRLLRETNKPVVQIMFDAGFATKSNFNREFRRVAGVNPGRYRARPDVKAGRQAAAGKSRT